MGTADIVTKEYMWENTVFADAFNYLIYNGKKVIDPEKLKEIDPTEIALPFGDEEKASEDKKRKNAGRADKKINAVYDALQYGRQVADIAAHHRRNKKDFTGKSNGMARYHCMK